jgi:hypothetical protein
MDGSSGQAEPSGSDEGTWTGRNRRREPRQRLVRPVEYAPFPRTSGEQLERRGVTRDVSTSGMCLRLEAPEPVGSLLRVIVADVEGRPALGSVGRVAWARPVAEGVWHVGLAVVTFRPIGQRLAAPGGVA